MDALQDIEELLDMGWTLRVFLVVTLTLLARYIAIRLLERLALHLQSNRVTWDDALLEAGRPSLTWLILIMGLTAAADIVNDFMTVSILSDPNILLVRKLTLIIVVAIFLVRFINILERDHLEQLKAGVTEEGRLDATTLTALAKLIRLAVIITSLLIVLPTLGIDVTALLAAGGVGGIALGFASRDLLANFFGGLMIYMDRPFAIGDWIRSPDRDIEGTVETIGWRLTKVRTFDKRPLYIPNSIFTGIALENPSRMQNRRIKETIGIRYRDADKMRSIIDAVNGMLINHEEIDATQTLIVNFNSYATSSLEFFIYTFTKTTNWVHYHEVKQDVMLKVVDIVHAHGADFAFPTTTLDGLPASL